MRLDATTSPFASRYTVRDMDRNQALANVVWVDDETHRWAQDNHWRLRDSVGMPQLDIHQAHRVVIHHGARLVQIFTSNPDARPHDYDDDAVCRVCGFDGAEWHHWKNNTWDGKASTARRPDCK